MTNPFQFSTTMVSVVGDLSTRLHILGLLFRFILSVCEWPYHGGWEQGWHQPGVHMLPLKRHRHLVGHHYPGVKLCAAVHPWVIQCAVVAFSVSFFMLHFWEEVIVSGGENPSVYFSPSSLFLSPLLCIHSPLLFLYFYLHASSFPSLNLSCLTSPLPLPSSHSPSLQETFGGVFLFWPGLSEWRGTPYLSHSHFHLPH